MSDLIITSSGARGIVGDSLTPITALKLASAFGKWLGGGRVIVGTDTRISSESLEKAVISGLLSQGCDVISVGVAPTPVIIHAKNKLGINAGIIISGSHNPKEWNALKLLTKDSFISEEELSEVKKLINDESINCCGRIINHNPFNDYLTDLLSFIKVRRAGLRVALDTGAGAGSLITPKVLSMIGCEVTLVNNELINGDLPRNPEPVSKNLDSLIKLMKTGLFDIGFAHDCDADRLVIIGKNGELFPEDTGLALIAKNYSNSLFVTNSASSMMFESILGKDRVIRVPVGERYLAVKMKEIGGSVMGGEGSCGGVMIPSFNNCRDGIMAAAKIIELIVNSGKSINELVNELPKYYSVKKIIKGVNINEAMNKLRSSVKEFEVFNKDVRVSGDDWFVIAHPSNTEPIIRVISEAKSQSKAEELVEWFSKLLN